MIGVEAMTERPGPFDLQVPFFDPLWRRVVTAGLPLAWAGFELLTGSVGWALIFAAAGLYAAWQFFVIWDQKRPEE